MTELSRHPEKSTAALRELDGWVSREASTIMASDSLTPEAKRRRLEQLRDEYRSRWLVAAQGAKKDLEEWGEIFEGRAQSAREPTRRDAGVVAVVEADVRRHKDAPGILLRKYEAAVQRGEHALAAEYEDAIPSLLPEAARGDFEARAAENKLARMSAEDRAKLEEAEAYSRERAAVEQGLGLMESHRAAGYVPSEPAPTMVVTRHRAGGDPPEALELPDPRYRDPSQEWPVNEPSGGTIGPAPSRS